MDHAEKWYDHKPPNVIENEDVKILGDMKMQTDHVIKHSRPAIVVHEKRKQKMHNNGCDM